MSGKDLTKLQVKLYMDSKLKCGTQIAASARTGISVSSACRMEKGSLTGNKREIYWQTRADPFVGVWKSVILPKLTQHPKMLAITILEFLQEIFPNQYPDNLLRTLQRKLKKWRALHGPEKEVIFNQEHFPGRMGISDFTELKGVTITINGQVFVHLLYHFRLSYSGWSFVKVVQGGESYTALTEGLQEALWRLGGSPREHRTDSLSAAFKNLSKDDADDVTKSYREFCGYYKMVATRNNRGVSHENGSIESPHGHVKRRIVQALMLRGSHDFADVKSYQDWIDTVVSNHNRRNAKEVEFERQSLQKLPLYKTTDFTEVVVKVHCSSTIEIQRVIYSVPSRLIGEMLRAHLYQDRIDLCFGSTKVLTLKRLYCSKNSKCRSARIKSVDYKHVIHSLHKKPQAFRSSQIRNELLPNEKFRFIWEHINKTMAPREACKFIVGILYIADKYNCEDDVGTYVADLIHDKKPLSMVAIERRYRKSENYVPEITINQHPLKDYDQLLGVQI
jgi:transposase InsO family protein